MTPIYPSVMVHMIENQREKDQRRRITGRRIWRRKNEKWWGNEYIRDTYQTLHRETNREIDQDVYGEANWNISNAMFQSTLPRGINNSMPITNDCRDILLSMRKSTSALQYMVSMTTYWDANKLDVWWSPIATNYAISRYSNWCWFRSGSSTINHGSRFKVGLKVVLLCF